MAMGKRRKRQRSLWVRTSSMAKSPGHPFYERLSRLLDEEGFDAFVERECARFYAPTMGRPSLAPGVYFRLLLIGYFEGIDAERGVAWRVADSLTLREFLGFELSDATTDHSTISRTRRVFEDHRDFLQRLFDTGGVAPVSRLYRHRDHGASVHIDRVLFLVSQMRAAIFHPRDLRVWIVWIHPVVRARATMSSWSAWPRLRASKRRRARICRGWIASAKRKARMTTG